VVVVADEGEVDGGVCEVVCDEVDDGDEGVLQASIQVPMEPVQSMRKQTSTVLGMVMGVRLNLDFIS